MTDITLATEQTDDIADDVSQENGEFEQTQGNVSLLLSFIRKPNIAEQIDDDQLMLFGQQVVNHFDSDLDSMGEWSTLLEEGREIARQEMNAKSQPWEGASNFKSPAILEASIAFGDRAQTELLRDPNLVKTEVIGNDATGEKAKAADRVATFENYQINHVIKGWRKKQGRMFYEVSAAGAVFKKTFFDSVEGKNKSVIIKWPNFAVNQATSSIEEALSFTHIMDISLNQATEKMRAGVWRECELYPERAEGDTGSNEEQEVEQAYDNDEQFLEQVCFLDIDGDGYQEPYIATVHRKTNKVVRIVARYEEKDIIVRDQLGRTRRVFPGESGFGLTLISIEARTNITPYGFIPNPDGTFLDIGYYHLLGPLSKAINATANQLIDAGTLANLQGGFLAKGFRKRMGNLKVKPGVWESTDISAQDLAAGVQPYKFKEPSGTLLTLNQNLETKIKEFAVNVDLKGVMAPNAPATTTLGLIQEAMLPTSAILQRFVIAESEEFNKLFQLNSVFTDPALYQNVLDDPAADFKSDYNRAAMDIKPTANPEMSSQIQRLQLGEVMLSQVERIQQAGGDVRGVIDFWLSNIGAPDDVSAQLFPDPAQATEEQMVRMQQQAQAQEEQRQLVILQLQQVQEQIDIQRQRADNDTARAENDRLETLSKLRVDESTIQNNLANATLRLEQAETEETKNQISKYTAQLQAVREAVQNTIAEIEQNRVDRQNAVPAG